MSGSYRNVIRGLWLSSAGLSLVAMSAVMLASLTPYSSVHMYRDGVHYFATGAMVHSIERGCHWLFALGLGIGFIGRCFCHAVPTAVKTALARIWLTVAFEACSLLSAASLYAMYMLFAPLAQYVGLTSFLFTLTTAYIARVQFLRFARALAEHADPSLLPEVTAAQRLYLYVPGGFFLAFGVRVAGVLVSQNSGDGLAEACAGVFAWMIATVATVVGVIGVWRWAGLLAGLRKAVARAGNAETHAAAADDPDREYRECYEQRLGLGRAGLVEES